MTYDVHAHVATLEDPRVAKLHADAEVFDPRTEVCNPLAFICSFIPSTIMPVWPAICTHFWY
jgi:hypothetical protein